MAHLSTHGMEPCPFCRALTAHDRVCRRCGVGGHRRTPAPPVAKRLVRCPGWGCALAVNCQRYLAPGEGPQSTLWMEPGYDRLLQQCSAHMPGAPLATPVVPLDPPAAPTLDWPQGWAYEYLPLENVWVRLRIVGRHQLTAGVTWWRIDAYAAGHWTPVAERRRGRYCPHAQQGAAYQAAEAFQHYMNNLHAA